MLTFTKICFATASTVSALQLRSDIEVGLIDQPVPEDVVVQIKEEEGSNDYQTLDDENEAVVHPPAEEEPEAEKRVCINRRVLKCSAAALVAGCCALAGSMVFTSHGDCSSDTHSNETPGMEVVNPYCWRGSRKDF